MYHLALYVSAIYIFHQKPGGEENVYNESSSKEVCKKTKKILNNAAMFYSKPISTKPNYEKTGKITVMF